MAKYYVQSGTLRCLVSAENPRRAALWAVHRAMQQILPIEEAAPADADSKTRRGKGQQLMVLGGTIKTSERGFDGADASTMPTFEVVTEWNQLVNTLDRLEGLLR